MTAWVRGTEELMGNFNIGDIVVYLDGDYFRLDEADIEFEGMYATHKLARLPHAEALASPSKLTEVLGDSDYWLSRERQIGNN